MGPIRVLGQWPIDRKKKHIHQIAKEPPRPSYRRPPPPRYCPRLPPHSNRRAVDI
jgi:hypothetical protein